MIQLLSAFLLLAFLSVLDTSVVNLCSVDDWRCSDGSCVSKLLKCDGDVHCSDGSDEMHCRNVRLTENICVLPKPPDNKTRYNSNIENGEPGKAYDYVILNIICEKGYGVEGPGEVYCFNGKWSPTKQIPKCVRECHLPPHPSVEYRCLLSGSEEGSRVCNEYELSGTEVVPRCRSPVYYSPTDLAYMRCFDGTWDYIAKCTSDCGTLTPEGTQLIFGGSTAQRGEVPWHAAIYTKDSRPYKQICGGTLISNNLVLSAAHCFWSNLDGTQQRADKFAVAVGKLYRPWNNKNDDAQRSDVKAVHLPVHFQGSAANYQGDIAVVEVTTAFVYKVHVRPACIDFDPQFQEKQLQPGAKGKIAGWGLTASNAAAPVLQVIDLPYVSVPTCIANVEVTFRGYITSDKICAGYKDAGKALCKGDSGGGLTFSAMDLRGTERYFLRGIASTASNKIDVPCNAYTYTTFTLLKAHEHFIKKYWVAEGVTRVDTNLLTNDRTPISLRDKCVVPKYPASATYTTNKLNAKTGDAFDQVNVNVSCQQGYEIIGPSQYICVKGQWWPADHTPLCVIRALQCRTLNSSPEYRCLHSTQGSKECNKFVFTGKERNFVCPIPVSIHPGRRIRLHASTLPTTETFEINLQCNANLEQPDDIAMHLAFRISECNCVIRNHLTTSLFGEKVWGPEERKNAVLPISLGESFEVTILCEETAFKISINGKHFLDFQHRIPYRRITHLRFKGEVHVQDITFEGAQVSGKS